MHSYEQQFSISCLGIVSPQVSTRGIQRNTIILHIESKRAPKCCPQCGHAHLVKNGFRTRDFISLPIGGKKVILRMKVRRNKCKCVDCDCLERISFALGSHSYTRRFARYVVDLLKGITFKYTESLISSYSPSSPSTVEIRICFIA